MLRAGYQQRYKGVGPRVQLVKCGEGLAQQSGGERGRMEEQNSGM